MINNIFVGEIFSGRKHPGLRACRLVGLLAVLLAFLLPLKVYSAELQVVQPPLSTGIIVSGTGYASNSPSDNVNGFALLLGYNGNSNRQLWIGASDGIGSSTTSFFRYIAGGQYIASIDAVSGDGLARMPVAIGTDNTSVTVGVPPAWLAYNAVLPGKLTIYNEASKNALSIQGASGQTGKYLEVTANGGAAGGILSVLSNGNVGIGATSPAYPLHMASGARVTAGGVWTNASSREYKENIHELTITEAVDALGKLDPVKYNYKVDQEDRHVGFIAEDVPDLVATKDRKGLSPMDIVAVLTKVVQEQQKTISELSEKVADLQREVKLRGSVASAR